MRDWIERHQVLAVAAAGAAAFAFWQLRAVFVILFLGYILAAALRPAIDWLNQRLQVPRILAIVLLYAACVAILSGIIAPAAALMLEQGRLFAAQLGMLSHLLDKQGFLVTQAQIQNLVTYLQGQAVQAGALGLVLVVGLVSSVIVSIYLLNDWHELHARLHRNGGDHRVRHLFAAIVRDSEAALGAWVRGQLLLSTIVAGAVFVALTILGIEFAPVLAALAWIFELVPYAGPFLAAAPAVLLALNHSTEAALAVVVVYVIIQQIESHLLVPMVMRRSVDLHPVVSIAVMLAGFEILGIPGVLLAVPAAVLVRIAAQHIWFD